jgi:hypothetical protein
MIAARHLPMAGQAVEAALVAAPRQRNNELAKARIKAGEKAAEIWPDRPVRARQKDIDARWTVKFQEANPAADRKPQIDIAIPTFGYKSHISIDLRHRVIRRGKTTAAAARDAARLRDGLIDPNTPPPMVTRPIGRRRRAVSGRNQPHSSTQAASRPMPRHTRASANKSGARAHVSIPVRTRRGSWGWRYATSVSPKRVQH